MDIWVRSQDKESICKVSGLTFSDECDNVALAGSFKRCPHYDIFQIPEDKHV